MCKLRCGGFNTSSRGAQSPPVPSKSKRGPSPPKAALFANAAMVLAPDAVQSELGWQTNFHKRYAQGGVLGEGSFGKVYCGVDLETGQHVAVKAMDKKRDRLSRDKTLEKLAVEAEILMRVQGAANVVELMGCYEDADHGMFVTELLSGGDLQTLSEATGPLPERVLAFIAWELLRCIQACHKARVLHGDIKPANFVLKSKAISPLTASPEALASSGWVKAVDFGCSQCMSDTKRFTFRKGTPVYMAPEIFDRDYGTEVDMWSLGVSLYQLSSRRLPFWDTYGPCKASSIDEVESAVRHAVIPFNYGPWFKMSRGGKEFISLCLTRDPTKRLTPEEALQHPWLQKQMSSRVGVMGARPTLTMSTARMGGYGARSLVPAS